MAHRRSRGRASSSQASALDLGGAATRYARLSTRPLHVLLFLLPLVLIYEIGSVLYLSEEVRAERMLGQFFNWFDVGWVHLPAALTVIVLLAWHVLIGDRWRVRPSVLGRMVLESAVWTLCLIVLGQVLARVLGIESARGLMAPGAGGSVGAAGGGGLDWKGLATIAIGAGIYEELLFRMVGLALVHFILVDLLGMRDTLGKVGAILATSIAFALYHDGVVVGAGVAWALMIYYVVAGSAFAGLYLARGFGIVVAVHALYDVIVLVRPFG